MIKAGYKDKNLVVDILTESFDTNISVNFVVKQDKDRVNRIRMLMEYSFDLCYMFGQIYLSDNKNACALILFPEQQKTSFKTIILDIKLACFSIGITRVSKVLKRNTIIKSNYPDMDILYLWFIGVIPSQQGKGLGKELLSEIINVSILKQRPIYLETSMKENLKFYQSNDFEIYKEIEIPHQLFLIRKNLI